MKKRQVVVRRNSSSSTAPASTGSTTSSSSMMRFVRYGECQKNHAASIGGYALDGCREFMPSGDNASTAALTCAACGCHRNFHRRHLDQAEVVCEYSPPLN